MIDKVMMSIGAAFLLLGGAILFVAVFTFFGYLFACIWIAASNKWRRICQAESLIFEYRKNRKMYLAWKKEQESDHEQNKPVQ